MTIIIGIICKDSIVLASDSQTTRDGMKRTDAKKITSIKFGDLAVLIAKAGNAGNADRAIELLREAAKTTPITDYRKPAEMARDAMIRVKSELKEQYCNCTMTELQDLIQTKELQSELMLAYYFDNKPYLYTVDFAVTRCDKETSWCSAIGCGANLGSYLLSEHTKKDMNRDLCIAMASYIVEIVCKHDAYCNLPVCTGVLVKDIGEPAKAETGKECSPEAHGLGLVVISTPKPTEMRQRRKLEKIIESEKERRNKAIEKMLLKEVSKSKKVWNDFMTSKTQSSRKISKMVNQWGVNLFDTFKSK